MERRRKQIEYGKNTPEYHNYREAVPRDNRESFHPKTPNMKRKYSRRAWDGLIRQWRIQLHLWSDPQALVTNKRRNVESRSSESSGGEAKDQKIKKIKTEGDEDGGDLEHKEVSWFEETEDFYNDDEDDNIHVTV